MQRPTSGSPDSDSRRREAVVPGPESGGDPGSRGTTAVREGRERPEPLAASWNPEPERPTPPRRRGLTARYGWRLYAVPLLVVATALAVFQVAEPASNRADDASGGREQAADVPEAPVLEEAPPGQQYSPEMFSADLPPGAPIPESGAGTFDVLPGSSPQVGQGDMYRYTIEVETGVELTEGRDSFDNLVQQTLSDPRSWTNPEAGGIALQRVDGQGQPPDFRVTLVSQNTARQVCGYGQGLPFDTSCRIDERVYINAARWVRGAISFEGDSGTYRRYAINHEVGHVFDNPHVPCGQDGALAPVMMQQTFSVANDELHELNKAVPQGADIPRDGKVCKYNAWPFPVAG